MKQKVFYHAAAYIRLSREDGDKAESDSIGNQKKLIADYLKSQSDIILYDIYVDDGFSGTNFERPGFKRMMNDTESGKVDCVIVKDLSRFGRDYIETGKYLERYFPDNDIRFIAITDCIDSAKQAYDMLLPIKNIFNEQYARDISGKIHASVQAKQKAGEFIGAFASYGYQKSPVDKNKLVIDTYAAEVVKRIFALYLKGYGKLRIANILNEEGIVCPSEYKRLNGERYRNSNRLESTSYWTYSTINRILHNEMYIGNMVQGRKSQHMRSRAKAKDRGEWIIVQGTHEAIIDQKTWEKTRDLLNRRSRSFNPDVNANIFAGFLKCGDCGRAMVRKGKQYFCGTYVRSGRQYCTPHKIPYQVLEKILLEDLRLILQNVNHMEELIRTQEEASVTAFGFETQKERIRLQISLDRICNLKKAVYEDYREGLITKEEFIAYRQDYIQKEELLTKQMVSLTSGMETQRRKNISGQPWLRRLLECKQVECLDRDIVSEMLYEIKVYENNTLRIAYNFSGGLSELTAKNRRHMAAQTPAK